MAIFNPLLISIICVIGVPLIFHIDYDDYNEGGKYISYLLTPATVCLAVPLYEQIHLLKKNLKAVAAGIFSGTLAGLCSILLMAKLFGFDHQEYVTMLPKSITTAIGMGVSEELGGIVTITVAVIIITGVLGNMIAEVVYKIEMCIRDRLFSENGGSIRNRRGIRLRKKHCGEDDHTSDRTHRRRDFSHGKGYHTCKGKKSPGNLPGNADDFSDTGRIL